MRVRFALLADVQRPSGDALVPLRKAVQDSQEKGPDFTVFCGDLVDHPDSEAEYANVLPVMAQISSPLYYVIGNHDADSGAADYSSLFRLKTGLTRTYYSFDHSGYHFLVLDTVEIANGEVQHLGRLSKAQLDWVSEDLKGISKEIPLVIFSHNPLLETDRFGVANAEEFYSLVSLRPVIAAFSAHTHHNQVTRVHGIPVIISGPLSFGLRGQETLGYRWIEIIERQVTHYWVPVATMGG